MGTDRKGLWINEPYIEEKNMSEKHLKDVASTTSVKNAVNQLVDFHRKNLKEGRIKDGELYLGRMFSLGAWFQYFLAKELIKGTGYKALVDCPITFDGRRQPLYPDILIIKEKGQTQELKCVIDVKLDLGFIDSEEFGFKVLSDKGDYKYEDKKNKFKDIYGDFLKAAKFRYHEKDEYNKIRKQKNENGRDDYKECIIGGNIRKLAVVLMENINHHNRREGYKEAVKRAGFTYAGILKRKDSDVRVPGKKIKEIVKADIDKNPEIKRLLI